MYNGQRVAVVVTAYCEEGFVGEVLRTVPAFVDRIYVIDDASPDGTWAEIRETADQLNLAWNGATAIADGGTPRQRVVPIRHEENRGYGGAVKTGYRHAYADGMDVVAVMDGDGQMDPAILSRIIDPVAAGRLGSLRERKPTLETGRPRRHVFVSPLRQPTAVDGHKTRDRLLGAD